MSEVNKEMRTAWDFVEHTGHSIFLTGKAGTGKTTFLKTLVERSTKRMVVVAPTGVAAINAGGVTIHSFFQIPLTPFVPGAQMKNRFDFSKEKRKIIASLDLLVIDEISMVRSDLLDAIDAVLRRFRDRYKPFGGLQLLMIGDLQQLTPVVTPDEEAILKPYYDTPYFFGSKALAETNYVTIQLEKVYRQQDPTFVNILNHVREGRPTADDLAKLNSRYLPLFRPQPEEGYIRLSTHNYMANRYNEQELQRLQTPAVSYRATVEGNFPEYAYPTHLELTLKVGAQVMFIRNDNSGEQRYFNGRIGRVTYAAANSLRVVCTGETKEIEVEMEEWENAKYVLNPETKEIMTEVQGTFKQYPLRLAWAITIHKSQGLTFEHAIIDAGQSFAPGQVYVALSRCKTIEGLVLASPIDLPSIINDERVDTYIARQEVEATESIRRLPELKEEYYRQLLLELFDFRTIYYKEEYLSRQLMEFCATTHAALTQMHRHALQDVKEKVLEVGEKWRRQIEASPIATLHDAAFLDRVKRSAAYFCQALHDSLEHPLELCKTATVKNKDAARRMSDVYAELTLLYGSRRQLLDRISRQGFSVVMYLSEKQRTLLEQMDNSASASRSKRKRQETKTKANHDQAKQQKPKEEKVKEEKAMAEKVKSHEITYQLFLQGMQVEEIAIRRGMAPSTIYSHLDHYVETGDIQLEDLVDKEKICLIRKAMAKAEEPGLKAVKQLCPDEISYEEIRMVVKQYQ